MATALVSGSKRGYGACPACRKEYMNRKKPKTCACGFDLGGSFSRIVGAPSRSSVARSYPPCVLIFDVNGLKLTSVKTTPRDDRQFTISSPSDKLCYMKKCLDYRGTLSQSGNLSLFCCEHFQLQPEDAVYSITFTDEDIEKFTPDLNIQMKLKQVNQEQKIKNQPVVVKVTSKTYAVAGIVSTTSATGFTHVRNEDGGLVCKRVECQKKVGKTVHVKQHKVCLHKHFVLLAREIKENPSSVVNTSNSVSSADNVRTEISAISSKDVITSQRHLTLLLQLKRPIPYKIPINIVNKSDSLDYGNEQLIFEPTEQNCGLCNSLLPGSVFPHGCSSTENGILLVNKQPFKKINIKVKKCSNSNCGATTITFPYDQGLFNVCNKLLVGIDIMLEWREYLKDGIPLTNIIFRKCKSLLLKVSEELHPTENELKYLVELLYNGFYGFECLTERDLNSVICGYCGIVGKVYYGDGNQKNCCTVKDIVKDDADSSIQIVKEKLHENGGLMASCLNAIRYHLIEKCIYSNSRLKFSIKINEIPSIIPSSMRSSEINTELQKKSIYLKSSSPIEGDPIIMCQLFNQKRLSIEDLESLDTGAIIEIAKSCKIKVQGKSQDMLRMNIRQLYASIIVGKSSCHEFVKSPGHTGGFYHLVCPHGTTVCSKFMALTESVRDAADLWLSLKYPPVLFVCDTPCTFVQHLNQRAPAFSKEYWGELNGCFETPVLGKLPEQGVNVPDIIPSEFQSVESCKNPMESDIQYHHPLTGNKRRYVCGDRFHSEKNPHKSPLCQYHNIDLCQQSATIKTSFQESLNNKKNKKRNRSACTQDILHHIFYNYLMNFYDNEEVVKKQEAVLKTSAGKLVKRDKYLRFFTE